MADGIFRDPAFMANRDVPVHRWVPGIAGFSKHFIADALGTYVNGHRETVLDPSAGVGTTLVESDLAGHDAIGFEINPYAAFAAQLKLRAHQVPVEKVCAVVEDLYVHAFTVEPIDQAPATAPPPGFRTRSPFYSPLVERKVLLMLDFVSRQQDELTADLLRLAFASTMVGYSNYSYEPSLGRRSVAGRANVDDHPVAACVAHKLSQIASDAAWYRDHRTRRQRTDGRVHLESFLDG